MVELVNSGNPLYFWFFSVALLGLTAMAACYTVACLRKKRIIANTPTSKIRSAAQGYVELYGDGTTINNKEIVAPSGRACIWYNIKIEEQNSGTVGFGSSMVWTPIFNESSKSLILLKDETGECIINPEGADVTGGAGSTLVWYDDSDLPTSYPPEKTPSLKKAQSPYSGDYRHTETILFVDEPLYAIGLFKTVGSARFSPEVKSDVSELLQEWNKNTAMVLARFDSNKDGKIDLGELNKIKAAAYKEIVQKNKKYQDMPQAHAMVNTHDPMRPFILSTLHETDLVKKMHNRLLIGYLALMLCVVSLSMLAYWRLAG